MKRVLIIWAVLFSLYLLGFTKLFVILTSIGVGLWLMFVIVDFFKSVHRWWTKPPTIVIYDQEKDPTRPDEHPVWQVSQNKFRRKK